jgi:hypothetical protein
MADSTVALRLLEQYWLSYAFGVPVWGRRASDALVARYDQTVALCARLGMRFG